jgi:hypothetical protein
LVQFSSERVSETEVTLNKVFDGRIEIMLAATDPVVVSLAKNADMGRKPVFESTSEVREAAIIIYVRRHVIELLIQLRKPRMYRISSRSSEKASAASVGVRG